MGTQLTLFDNPKSEIKLRQYQQEALDSIPESGAFLICLATGLGKTICMSQIPRKGRMLILSHRDELVHQPEKYFTCSFGVEQAGETSHNEEVVSASVQSLVRRLNKFQPDDFDILITDECHHATAPTYRKIYDYFKPRLHLGFTATPNRNDGVGLKEIYQDIIFERNLKWGIENGYLSDIHCLRVDIGYDLRHVAVRLGDYAPEALERAVNIEGANEAIAEAYRLYAKPPCLIFCTSVAHAKSLAKLIPGAVAVQGGEDRTETLQAFREGKIPCLTNCLVFTEGTDLPNVQSVIMARPTKNISLFTQCVGRGTRLSEGKEYLTLIDCVGAGDEADLCTAPSLLGLDISTVPPSKRKKLQGNLFDLPDIAYEEQDTPEAWIRNVHYVDLWAKRSSYNLHGVNFFRKPDGSLSILNILIPPEDSLGRVKWNGHLEPMQKVIDDVYERLKTEYADKKRLWDRDLIKQWGNAPATEKQRALVKRYAPVFDTDSLTKYEATQILQGQFVPQPATQKQIYFLACRGYNATNMSKQEASRLIAQIKGTF